MTLLPKGMWQAWQNDPSVRAGELARCSYSPSWALWPLSDHSPTTPRSVSAMDDRRRTVDDRRTTTDGHDRRRTGARPTTDGRRTDGRLTDDD